MRRFALLLPLALAGCASAMHKAAERGDLDAVRVLVEKGKSPQDPGALVAAVRSGNKALVEFLLDRGAKVDSDIGRGFTPLMIAAYRDDLPIVRLLVDRGADLNAGKGSWGTPFAGATDNGAMKTALFLLERGADIDGADHFGQTALWSAARKGKEDVVKFLLERGANPEVKGKAWDVWASMRTPLEIAREKGHSNVVRLLERHDAPAARAKAAADRRWAEVRERVEAAERAGDAAAKKGRGAQALARYVEAYNGYPESRDEKQVVLTKLLEVARLMSPPPSVPREAEDHASRAEAFIELAQDPAGFKKASAEYDKALELAPWWPEAHFNQGLALEKAGDPAGAIRSFKRFLLAAPKTPEAEGVRRKILKLEVAQELRSGKR